MIYTLALLTLLALSPANYHAASPEIEYLQDGTDLDKLIHAIGHFEGGHYKSYSCINRNNCWGMMYRGKHIHYENRKEGFESAKKNWKKNYGSYPNRTLVRNYIYGPNSGVSPDVKNVTNWLQTVNQYYRNDNCDFLY